MRISNICVFAATNENEALTSYLKKNDFENLQTGEHVNIFVFLIKTSCQSKESSLSK